MKVAELFEGKEENIARLRKDYKNAMAWVNAPKSELPDHERSKWEQQARKMREHAKKQYHIDLTEAVAAPFAKFKKGQIVTVKKTGEEVEVMSQNDIGLVFTASKDAVKIPNDKKLKVVPGKGYKEYMPRELEEGWKMGLAAAALSGAVVAGIANSPMNPHGSEKPNPSMIRIDGKIAMKALGPVGPFAKETIVEIDGKPTKVKYWRSVMSLQRGMLVYKKLDESRNNAPREDIPPYAVCYVQGDNVVDDNVFTGTREQCQDYMADHKPPKGKKFDLMDIDSGKLVSYKIPARTNEERVDEISLDTVQSYRAKRIGQQKPWDMAGKSHVGDHGKGNVAKGLLASYRRVQKAASVEAQKKKRDSGENEYGYGTGRYQGD